MAEFHIRGGLGTQALSIYAAYAIALETNQTVDRLYFNHGNYPSETKDANIVFVDSIFQFRNKPEFIIVNGVAKTSAFNVSNAALIIKHWNAIQQEVFLKKQHEQTEKYIVHIRRIDRALVPIEKFDDITHMLTAANINYDILSDDPLVYKRYGTRQASNDPVLDWETILSAKTVYGGFSTFTLLAGMLNPNLKLLIVRKECCDSSIVSDSDWIAIDMYVREFRNINWISI